MARTYVPDRGDVVWLELDPQAGHEQAGVRPALVISPRLYNRRVGLALFCPLTTHIKGYPFEVELPPGLKAKGAILSDQIKSLDWLFLAPTGNRRAQFTWIGDALSFSEPSQSVWLVP